MLLDDGDLVLDISLGSKRHFIHLKEAIRRQKQWVVSR